MTEKQKRIAIIVGTVILAILLLLFLKRSSSGNVVTAESPFEFPELIGPSLGPVYGGAPFNFSIPGLNLSGPDFSMIGACCSDCGQSSSYVDPYVSGARNTYVFNAANAGANIFNYSTVNNTQTTTTNPYGGLRFAAYG